MLQLNPRPFFFDFLLFLIIFLHTFQEAILAVRVLNMLNMHINSLGKNLALNLFAYNDANSMLGNTADSSTFAMATFVGHSFLNSTDCLDSHNISLLVDAHVCGQRNNPTFSKRSRGHSAGVPPLPLCVAHFGKLLEDGGSSRKAGKILMDREIISFPPEFGDLKEVIKAHGMVAEHWAGQCAAARPPADGGALQQEAQATSRASAANSAGKQDAAFNTPRSCYRRKFSQLNFNKFVVVFSGKMREDEVIRVIIKQRNILFFSGFSQES